MSEAKREVWVVEWHDALGKGTLAGYAFFTEDQALWHIQKSKEEDDVRAKHGRARAWEGCTWTATKFVPESAQPAERAGEWVSVEERLPEPCTGVLLATVDSTAYGYWDGHAEIGEFAWHVGGVLRYRNDIVTHWMPLPPPPQTKEKP